MKPKVTVIYSNDPKNISQLQDAFRLLACFFEERKNIQIREIGGGEH